MSGFKKFLSSVWEVLEVVIVSAAVVFFIRQFIAQPFLVSGASMEPNFYDGNYLIVDELSYRLGEPERGGAGATAHIEHALARRGGGVVVERLGELHELAVELVAAGDPARAGLLVPVAALLQIRIGHETCWTSSAARRS